MPHTNNWESHGVHRVFTGDVSGNEIFASNTELHSDRRFNKIDYIINDFSAITSHAISMPHTDVFALTDKMVARTKDSLMIALVVPQEEFHELAGNYCKQMQEHWFGCKIFRSLESARNWLENNLRPISA